MRRADLLALSRRFMLQPRVCYRSTAPVHIGTTLVGPWAACRAEPRRRRSDSGGICQSGGRLRHNLQQQVALWLHRNAGSALRYQNNLCGCYSDEGMTLLKLQTIYARLEEILKADRLQRAQLFEGRLDALHKLLSSTETTPSGPSSR
jgi:hypothetical protein